MNRSHHDSECPHSWNPVHQAKSFFNHEVILSQTSLDFIWILTELLWVFLRRSAWIVRLWGVTCLANERRNCVLESKPVGSTNSSWCSIKAYSTLNPINQTCTTNGSVPADLHKASQGCTAPPGSRDLPECWLVLEAEFLDHEVFLQAGAEMVMPLCKRLRVCVSFTVIVTAIVSKAASVGCFERILLHSGLAFWH